MLPSLALQAEFYGTFKVPCLVCLHEVCLPLLVDRGQSVAFFRNVGISTCPQKSDLTRQQSHRNLNFKSGSDEDYLVRFREQVVIKAIVRRSACKEQRRIQYETEWLFHCLLLRIKSPKAYDHPRGDGKSGILP
ncbi:hypothetical protein OUZ56_017630 [Daphnia magna]|uniref:Uncharacterized protein n=1 Tax=Daphnia magna TaxID=35525 RepID=A0ABR0ATA7_9CRUS|nr:hypothetical protein OUZ56_017630 [Daphnia magna]